MQYCPDNVMRTYVLPHMRMDIRQLVTRECNEDEEEKNAFSGTGDERGMPSWEAPILRLNQDARQVQSPEKPDVEVPYELEKPFFCQRCLSPFTTRKSLRVHVSTVHLKEKPHICNVCGRTFGTRSSMRRHMQTKHISTKTSDCDGDDESAEGSSRGKQHRSGSPLPLR
eukprot:Plantae.Rhodophyta-Purpureofilum_apyrenoidigerum.ctg22635.p1 GENE.Plantae.Rhodophyta-Purpureofilum_apyrenoidigerum.ctg22635~~Plantae.Rhodophyta-Purpureofilum_apyrenoidigerum.ctg22635.p1  ORF type:complete len:169 (+),score=16.83 Plantae.Rhodophyta-Purpureofilum_apyrenoidigerum.ctg22635:335-841(+)